MEKPMDFSGDGGFKQQKWRVLEGFCPEMRANLRQMSQAEMGDGGERLWVLVSKMFAFHFTWVSFIFILWALGLVIAAQNECCIRCNPTIARHGSIWVCVHLGYPQTWCLIMVHQHFPDSRIAVLGWNWGVHPFSETHTHTDCEVWEKKTPRWYPHHPWPGVPGGSANCVICDLIDLSIEKMKFNNDPF